MNIFQHCSSLTQLPFLFEPDNWKNFLSGNCYEYLLNFQNPTNKRLTVGSIIGKEFQPYQSNQDLLDILEKELSVLGFLLEESNNSNHIDFQRLKFFISRSRCGDYHFYRLDSNGEWSHKFSYSNPSNLDFNGNKIILPEQVCYTDINIGYFSLKLAKT